MGEQIKFTCVLYRYKKEEKPISLHKDIACESVPSFGHTLAIQIQQDTWLRCEVDEVRHTVSDDTLTEAHVETLLVRAKIIQWVRKGNSQTTDPLPTFPDIIDTLEKRGWEKWTPLVSC